MAYLFTWNPNEWGWEDFEDVCEEVRTNGFHDGRWSSGVSKSIMAGERFFFLRQGVEPRGIIGSGTTLSDTYQDDKWRDDKTEGNYNELHWDVLLNPSEVQILTVDELQAEIPISHNWQPMASGTKIKNEATVRELEIRWQRLLKRIGWNKETPVDLTDLAPAYSTREGRALLSWHLTRERDPRIVQLKKEDVLRRCGKLECVICGFDFFKVYGELGRGFCECHHRLPLNNGVRETELKDLSIVCANCHRMLHRSPEELTVEDLCVRLRPR